MNRGDQAMSTRIRFAAFAAVGVIAINFTATARAEDWPTRPVSMVVPFGAGSASDTVGRIIGAHLSELLGQQIFIENVSGAGGMTGAARVAHASPDGYQFLVGSVDTQAMNQTLYKKPMYNAATDFAPVRLTVEQPVVLLARSDFPANNLKEFADYVKTNQDKMQFGSSGLGSGTHLSCARLNMAIDAAPTHVPYRGSAQALQDLAAGRIDYLCALGAAAVAPIEGKIAKPIAVLARERSPLFPDIPSSQEQGLSGIETYFWSGFFFPKGTPAPIIQKMVDATTATLNAPAIRERLKKAGVTPVEPDRGTPEYLQKHLESEIAAWGKTIKDSGVSID
jgi:tripartite-type tricarboxylate transporter receptor subunit TctC